MTLPRLTLLLGGFLALLGVGFYLGTGRESVTALIPTFLGLPLIACALWARGEPSRHPALRVALVLALIGFAGTVSGVVKSAQGLAGQSVDRPEAAFAQALVALSCLGYLWVSLRSRLKARRAESASR